MAVLRSNKPKEETTDANGKKTSTKSVVEDKDNIKNVKQVDIIRKNFKSSKRGS